MTDVEPTEEQASAEPDVTQTETKPPEQTEAPAKSVAEAVKEAGVKQHETKRSLEELDPDIRRIVEDQVSAALSKKTQKGEYLTQDKFDARLAEELAKRDAADRAVHQFHNHLAASGILPGTPEYTKIEEVSKHFDNSTMLTPEGVQLMVRAAGLSPEQRKAEADADDGTPVTTFQEGAYMHPDTAKAADAPRRYGRDTSTSSLEARWKQLDAEGQ